MNEERYDLSKIAFKGEKRFLSNMYPAPIIFMGTEEQKKATPFLSFDGSTHRSSEHLYQSLKSNDAEWWKLVAETKDGKKVKSLARKHLIKKKTYAMREDWEEIKIEVMRVITFLKYQQNKELEDKLKNIQGRIIEENCWSDTFWGKCEGVGEDNLGKILTQYRDSLQ